MTWHIQVKIKAGSLSVQDLTTSPGLWRVSDRSAGGLSRLSRHARKIENSLGEGMNTIQQFWEITSRESGRSSLGDKALFYAGSAASMVLLASISSGSGSDQVKEAMIDGVFAELEEQINEISGK